MNPQPNILQIKHCRYCTKPFTTKANNNVFCSMRCRIDHDTERRGEDDCWFWYGHKDKDGYGRFHWHGKDIGAHVAAWQCEYGPVPTGLCVLHMCDHPSCVNPTHLWVGTVGDNNSDRHLKGRTKRKKGRPVLNLNTGERFESLSAAGRAYNVITTSIFNAANGRSRTSAGQRWQYAG